MREKMAVRIIIVIIFASSMVSQGGEESRIGQNQSQTIFEKKTKLNSRLAQLLLIIWVDFKIHSP
jgi:hypothetical protein